MWSRSRSGQLAPRGERGNVLASNASSLGLFTATREARERQAGARSGRLLEQEARLRLGEAGGIADDADRRQVLDFVRVVRRRRRGLRSRGGRLQAAGDVRSHALGSPLEPRGLHRIAVLEGNDLRL